MRWLMLPCFVAACATVPPPPAPPPPAVAPEAAAEAPPPDTPEPTVVKAAGTVSTPVVDPTCDATFACQGESCCTRIDVPGGTYRQQGKGDVAVQAFALDKYELTVGRVRRWSQAGHPVPAPGTVIGRDSAGASVVWSESWKVQRDAALAGWERYDTWSRENSDPLPKNHLDWYTAAAVCHFAGGRLPTDDEWRYAVVGGDENRRFPWGEANQTPDHAVYNCMGDGDVSCSGDDILAAGSKPLGAGRWGHLDLVGSLFEWTVDAVAEEGTVARGGGFCYIGGYDRRTRRVATEENVRRDEPGKQSHMVGARCAYDLEGGDRATVASR